MFVEKNGALWFSIDPNLGCSPNQLKKRPMYKNKKGLINTKRPITVLFR